MEKVKEKCSGIDCDKDAFARGMCRTHYSRWRVHGDCERVMIGRIPKQCEVDECKNPAHSRWRKGKAMCQKHWQAMYKYGELNPVFVNNTPPLPKCSVHKCEKTVVSRNNPYCDKHFGRLRRGADVNNDRLIKQQYTTASGYVVKTNSNHPMATKDFRLYAHREVAHDKHAGVCPPCYWCGANLTWSDAVIDHLDEDKKNNVPDNLVVACNTCNRARGAMLPFVARILATRITEALELLHTYCHDITKKRIENNG